MGSDERPLHQTVHEHLAELKTRLFWVILILVAGSVAAFSVSSKLLAFIQRPLGETLYYTSPVGGLSATFKLCAAVGVILALPIAVYHIFKFLEPLVSQRRNHKALKYTLISSLLAAAGLAFAYYISLPAALHFLNNFGGGSIESLITVDEYFNFVLIYLAGFAILFQLPLIIFFINRITPLPPGKIMGAQKYVILVSFIVAAILTPTPDPFNQTIMAVPAILLFQVGAIIVWWQNRKIHTLVEKVVGTVVGPEAQPAPPNLSTTYKRAVITPAGRKIVQPPTRRSIDGIIAVNTESISSRAY